MRTEYDFSHSIPNPYFKKLSKEITFRLDLRSLQYFEELGKPYDLPPEKMIQMYLRHMAGTQYKAELGLLTPEERGRLKESLEKQESPLGKA